MNVVDALIVMDLSNIPFVVYGLYFFGVVLVSNEKPCLRKMVIQCENSKLAVAVGFLII